MWSVPATSFRWSPPPAAVEPARHTEAAVELARLAGFQPAGVLCELMNPDGSMMRGAQIQDYAQRHALPILSVAELATWIAGQNLAAAPLSA